VNSGFQLHEKDLRQRNTPGKARIFAVFLEINETPY
jgi:hypothetical protein